MKLKKNRDAELLKAEHERKLNETLKKAEEIEASGDKAKTAYIYDELAFAYKDAGDYNKAIEYHEKSFDICRSKNEEKETPDTMSALASSYGNLGAVYKDVGDIQAAYENYMEAIRLGEKAAGRLRTPKAYDSLALLYLETALLQKNTPDSTMLLKALNIWETLIKENPDNQRYKSFRDTIKIMMSKRYQKRKRRRGFFGMFARRR